MKNNEHNEMARLLERFMAGESTIAEEQTLQRYFATHKVPPSWRPYQRMFAYFDAGMPTSRGEAEHTGQPRGPLAGAMRQRLMHWGSVAAAVALLAAIAAGWHGSVTPASQVTTPLPMATTTTTDHDRDTAAAATAPPTQAATGIAERQKPAPVAQAQPLAAAPKPKATKRRARQPGHDSIEVSRTQGALEAAEQEVIADRILLERELQQAQPAASGWVTVSLNIQ